MTAPAGGAREVLRLQGITRRFGPVLANDGIDLVLREGEIVALLGENGAGKTTLMNILFGHYAADAGTVSVCGRPLPPGRPGAALAAGVGMVHQHFTLADNLTVAENIVLGTRPLWRPGLGLAQASVRISALARDFGLAVEPTARVGSLTVGERQRVEILKALFRDARILILDEPTAVLTPQESEALFATLKRMVARGLSIIFISHKLKEVLAVADRVVVLRQGRVVGEAQAAGTDRGRLAELMVGAAIREARVAPAAAAGAELLRLEGVATAPAGAAPGLRGVDLVLQAGTITAIAGVSGNGQAALAALVAGLVLPTAGRLLVDGTVPARWAPRAALAAGIGRIPEDRHREGAIADFDLVENAILERYSVLTRAGLLSWKGARDWAARIIAAYDVRTPSADLPIRLLSGGNMQKLILGRVLEAGPRIILANQPTRGLDVGATAFVHGRLVAARDAGAAVLLISEDLDEALGLADRVHVMARGRLSPGFGRGQASAADLGLWMSGEAFAEEAHAA
ncbi:MAG: ABC transporter ATP-binding protein [Rhodobacteraceae bacterium]|nr:ABC transporter ATP-binding protein [Paracoccaceae bacterium]